MTTQPHLRVVVGFNKLSDHGVEELAGAVLARMTGNKAFPTAPVDLAALQAAIADLTTAIAAAAQGGPQATKDKNKKRQTLIGQLRKLALYVEGNCNDDLATLGSSGFQAVSKTRTQSALPKAVIALVDSINSMQLLVKVKPMRNAKSFEALYSLVGANGTPGTPQLAGGFTSSRSITLTGLTPGSTYTVQVRAVGGTTGYSDWSDPVSHMCI